MGLPKERRYLDQKLQRNEDIWARGLMRQILQMPHQQWSYQNATVNLKIKGCTRFEHNRLLEEIDQCLESDPRGFTTRPQAQATIMFANFEKLAKGTVTVNDNGYGYGWNSMRPIGP